MFWIRRQMTRHNVSAISCESGTKAPRPGALGNLVTTATTDITKLLPQPHYMCECGGSIQSVNNKPVWSLIVNLDTLCILYTIL